MASFIPLGLGALLLMCCVNKSFALVYTVGDATGWTNGLDYSTWTSGKTFSVGDSLAFNYAGGLHSVSEVSESDYKSCSASNAISSDGSGATTVQLKTAGDHYFICSTPGHCSNGMKLQVTVAAAASSGTTPSTTPSTSTPSTSTPAAPGTTTNPPSITTPSIGRHYSPAAGIAPAKPALVFTVAALVKLALSLA